MTLLLSLVFPFLAMAQDASTANLFELNSNQKQKIFTLSIETAAKEDGTHTEAVYKDLQGQEVVREQGLIQGAQVVRYQIQRPQTQEFGRFYVEGEKLKFEYEGPGGKKKSSEEKLKGQILCTANFNAFVRENWDGLSRGEGLDVRFAVWDRLETVGFTLKKMGDVEKDGEKWMELRLKPTSFVIAALVDPVYLWYSQGDKQLKVMKGRVAPKQLRGGKWKDLDAEVIYNYSPRSVSK